MIAAEGILTAKGGVSSHRRWWPGKWQGLRLRAPAPCKSIRCQDYERRWRGLPRRRCHLNQRYRWRSLSGALPRPLRKSSRCSWKNLSRQRKPTYQMFKRLMDWCNKATRLQSAPMPTLLSKPQMPWLSALLASACVAPSICSRRQSHRRHARDDSGRDERGRKKALAKLLPYQRGDFAGIFRELKGLPATIRFLDPPLHEFLPHDHASQNLLAERMGIKSKNQSSSQRIARVQPDARIPWLPPWPRLSRDLGDAGRAVFEAAAEVQKEGIKVKPEIMIPLVGSSANSISRSKSFIASPRRSWPRRR